MHVDKLFYLTTAGLILSLPSAFLCLSFRPLTGMRRLNKCKSITIGMHQRRRLAAVPLAQNACDIKGSVSVPTRKLSDLCQARRLLPAVENEQCALQFGSQMSVESEVSIFPPCS